MRLFGSERIANVDGPDGAPRRARSSRTASSRKSIERAQKRVEGNNFEARKRLLDYDDVMNQQREVIYDLRLFALEGGEDLKGEVWEMIEQRRATTRSTSTCPAEQPRGAGTWRACASGCCSTTSCWSSELPEENDPEHEIDRDTRSRSGSSAGSVTPFHRKLETLGEHAELVTSFIMLCVIDEKWKDHLYDLDHLKASIGFRGWGQKDPLVEYKQEAYEMFVDLMTDLRKTVASYFFRAQFGQQTQQPRPPAAARLLGTDGLTRACGGRAGGAGRASGPGRTRGRGTGGRVRHVGPGGGAGAPDLRSGSPPARDQPGRRSRRSRSR